MSVTSAFLREQTYDRTLELTGTDKAMSAQPSPELVARVPCCVLGVGSAEEHGKYVAVVRQCVGIENSERRAWP